jgi:flagellar protein FliS
MDYRKANLKQEYLKQSVMTASPAELIVMLFDACIKNLKLAEIDLNDNSNYSGAHTHFINARKFSWSLSTVSIPVLTSPRSSWPFMNSSSAPSVK